MKKTFTLSVIAVFSSLLCLSQPTVTDSTVTDTIISPWPCQATVTFDIAMNKSLPPQYYFIPSRADSFAKYYWDFGDGSYSEQMTPTHTYDFSGMYTVCLSYTTPDGCISYVCDSLLAQGSDPACKAKWDAYPLQYEAYDPAVIIAPSANTFFFRDLSHGDVVKWRWDFGDGQTSTEQHPYHQYEKSGTFLVCLEIVTSDGCSSSFCDTVFVSTPQFCDQTGTVKDYSGLDGCGLLIKLDNGILLEPAEIVPEFVLYDGQRVQLGYTELQDRASICMAGIVARIDCISEIYKDSCSAEFIHYPLPWVSSVPRLYQFEMIHPDRSITSVLWDFGDGTTSDEFAPMHRFPYDGYYTVCLKISRLIGCEAYSCQTAYFDGYEPQPGLCENNIRLTTDIILNGNECNGSARATLVDKNGNTVYDAKYYWSTGETGPEIYNLCPGITYNVIVTDSSGCAVSGSFSFGDPVVYPDSLFGYWNYQQDYLDFIFNLPLYSDSLYCEWDFGDGETAEGSSVRHSFNSTDPQTVLLKIFDGSGNLLFDQEILVSPGAPTGTHNPEPPEAVVYPVPAKEWLYISISGEDQVHHVEIMSAGGQLLINSSQPRDGNRLSLNVSALPPGFYLGRLRYENGLTQTFKFVK